MEIEVRKYGHDFIAEVEYSARVEKDTMLITCEVCGQNETIEEPYSEDDFEGIEKWDSHSLHGFFEHDFSDFINDNFTPEQENENVDPITLSGSDLRI
jgi:hypothetical protein